MRSLLFSAAVLLAALPGCDLGTLDSLSSDTAAPAGSELTQLARGLLTKYDTGSDADYKALLKDVDGVSNRAIQQANNETGLKLDDLAPADIAPLKLAPRDVTAAQGMILLTEITCSLDQIEKLVIATNQDALYPKTYDAYKRTFTSSAPDFLARRAPTVTWDTDLTATVLSRQYQSLLKGSARYVSGASPTGGPVLLARTILPAPAKFLKGTDAEFRQDYQIEAFYERGPGKVAHVYAMWREFIIGSLSTESELYISIILGNLKDFDVRTGKICRDGTPTPVVQ